MNKNNIHHNTQTKVWLKNNTDRICITAHNDDHDPVYFGITFDIDTDEPKQSKKATTSINEPNGETVNAIGAVVIGIHRQTQTENMLFEHFFHCQFRCSILPKTTFFGLCSLTCNNSYSIYNTENFTIWFIDLTGAFLDCFDL